MAPAKHGSSLLEKAARTRGASQSRPSGSRSMPHVHLYRWAGDSGYGSLYACRCGDVRPAI